MTEDTTASTTTVIEELWKPLLRKDEQEEKKEEDKADMVVEPSVLWTQARTQMLALEERAAKRAKIEQAKIREREANVLAMRMELENAARRNQALQGYTRIRREEELRLEEEKRAEARRREREQRETMAATVQFEEVWEVFN